MAIDPRFLQEILSQTFGGIQGPTGMPLYNQEQPTDLLTGKPYFQQKPQAMNIGVGQLGQMEGLKGSVSPALNGRNATMNPAPAVNGQSQFNSREALDNYRNSNMAGQGGGQLSDQFMEAWKQSNIAKAKEAGMVEQADGTYAKNNEEAAGAKAMGAVSTAFNSNPWGAKWSDTPPPRPATPAVYGNNNMMGDFDVSPSKTSAQPQPQTQPQDAVELAFQGHLADNPDAQPKSIIDILKYLSEVPNLRKQWGVTNR